VLTVSYYEDQANLTFGIPFTVQPNTVKFTILVEDWPFQHPNNSLTGLLGIRVGALQAKLVQEKTQHRFIRGYIETDTNTKFSYQFLDYALVDDTMNITTTFAQAPFEVLFGQTLDNIQAASLDVLSVAIDFFHPTTRIAYDPGI
jgi:hypothetical protein